MSKYVQFFPIFARLTPPKKIKIKITMENMTYDSQKKKKKEQKKRVN